MMHDSSHLILPELVRKIGHPERHRILATGRDMSDQQDAKTLARFVQKHLSHPEPNATLVGRIPPRAPISPHPSATLESFIISSKKCETSGPILEQQDISIQIIKSRLELPPPSPSITEISDNSNKFKIKKAPGEDALLAELFEQPTDLITPAIHRQK